MNDSEIVPATIDKVFVPQSFDSNDEAEIVIAGVFRDTCHSIAPVTVELDPTAKRIHVTAPTLRQRSTYCLEMDVPYSRKIPLGTLAPGEYQITLEDYPQTIDILSIAATHNPQRDDFEFAPVSQVRFDSVTKELTIEGIFPNDCYELRELRLIHESDEILLVLPIAESFQDGECGEEEALYSRKVTLRQLEGRIAPALLYIRTEGGGSIARVLRF